MQNKFSVKMIKINLQTVKDKFNLERQEIERKEEIIKSINSKLEQIDEIKKKIQTWDKSTKNAKSHSDKAILIQAKYDGEGEIEKLTEEIEKLWETIEGELPEQDSSIPEKSDKSIVTETATHRKWLSKNLMLYLGFAVASLLMFMLIHGSQFLISHEWSELLNTVRYTHQIFLKIAIGFFGILCIGISVNLLIPAILWYFNSKVNTYDFVQDFLNSDARTRLLVSCFVLYTLMEYWGKIMSWEIVL